MFVRAYSLIMNSVTRSVYNHFKKLRDVISFILIFRLYFPKAIYRNNNKKRKIAEALFIKEYKPPLNVQEKSVPLKLLN